MPFIGNNNGSNGSNGYGNNGGEQPKQKTNFTIGRIYGSNGRLDVSIWISDTGVKTIFTITKGLRDTDGKIIYEQKKPSELPRFFANPSILRAIAESIDVGKQNPGSMHSIIATPSGKIEFVGQGESVVINVTSNTDKIKDSRTITLDAVSCGNSVIHADLLNLDHYIKVALKHGLNSKLDKSVFDVGNDDGDDVPWNG